jgi:hypothetical protein
VECAIWGESLDKEKILVKELLAADQLFTIEEPPAGIEAYPWLGTHVTLRDDPNLRRVGGRDG